MMLMFIYQTLDALDGKHARRTGNGSPMGELFDHACDNVGVIFIVQSLCLVLGVEDHATQWHLVQIAQLTFLDSHLTAFVSKNVKFSAFAGPGEAIWGCMLVMCIRAVFGIDWLWSHVVTPATLAEIVRHGYGIIMFATLAKGLLTLPNGNEYFATKFGLGLVFLLRAFRAVLFYEGRGWWWGAPLDHPHTMLLTIIIDGLFMSVVTSDLIVAKMASRQLHTFVAITAMVSVFSNVLTLVLCVGYYIRVFHEISKGLHLPLFIPIVNIFVDGVYDLCHVDHHLQIQFAAQHGDRVFVGVVPDEEAKGYKREPIMTEREREESVRANKDTYMVVKSPASGVTEEMLRKLNIHKVVVGEEYCDPSNAKLYAYYEPARRVCEVVPKPRGGILSTSALIQRVLDKAPQEMWDKAAAKRASK
mmetsp:Transcript_19579/g.42282  ORF Transcript_19579/g.42282 Transcript_19579/m.42282 type:complete len:417 (-) Transcript_19579:75-1325(-)